VARSGAAAINAALSSIDDAELIALTRDLVRIPSVIRPGDATATEAEVARYIERWFGKQGFGVEVHEVAPGHRLLQAIPLRRTMQRSFPKISPDVCVCA